MDRIQIWGRITVVGPDGRALVCRVLEGSGQPDLTAVDEVARSALLATRLGGHVVLTEVTPTLRALLDLAGLVVETQG